MSPSPFENLSRRERQIMDVIFERGTATAAEVQEAIPDPPSYSAVRALLRILVDKGHLTHQREGARYVYSPVVNREKAKKSAIRQVVQTFFDDSPEQAVAYLLNQSHNNLDREALDRLARMIEESRKEGR